MQLTIPMSKKNHSKTVYDQMLSRYRKQLFVTESLWTFRFKSMFMHMKRHASLDVSFYEARVTRLTLQQFMACRHTNTITEFK